MLEFLKLAMVPAAGGSIFGFNAAIISGVNRPIINCVFTNNTNAELDSPEQANLQGILASCLVVGACVGSFSADMITRNLGHRRAILLTGTLCTIFSICLGLFANLIWLILVRTLQGLSVGMASVVAPIFVQTTPKAYRGRLGTLFQIFVCFSNLVAFLLNYAENPESHECVSDFTWRIQLMCGAIPGIWFMVAAKFVSNPPPEAAVTLEMSQGLFKNFRQNIRWIVLAFTLAGSAQLTGIAAYIVFSPLIFKSAGADNYLILSLLVVGVGNQLAVCIIFVLVDRFSRRSLMLTGLFLKTVASILLVISILYISGPAKLATTITAVLLFELGFEIGPGSLFFVLNTESFPKHIQNAACSLSSALFWTFQIVMTYSFPVIRSTLGSAAPFLIYSGFGVLFSVAIFVLLRPGSVPVATKAVAELDILDSSPTPRNMVERDTDTLLDD